MIGVGGPNMDALGWNNATSNDESLATFVYTTTEFLKHLRLDGLDIAWYYPNPEGKYSLSSLCGHHTLPLCILR